MKTIHIFLEEKEYIMARARKGRMTWKDFLLRERSIETVGSDGEKKDD